MIEEYVRLRIHIELETSAQAGGNGKLERRCCVVVCHLIESNNIVKVGSSGWQKRQSPHFPSEIALEPPLSSRYIG